MKQPDVLQPLSAANYQGIEGQSQTHYLVLFDSGERTSPEEEMRAPSLLTAITGITALIAKNPLWKSLFIGCASYFVTKVVKKMCSGYSITGQITELGLRFVNNFPYFHITATIVVVVFSFIMLEVACVVAGIVGAVTAFTSDLESRIAAAYGRTSDTDAVFVV